MSGVGNTQLQNRKNVEFQIHSISFCKASAITAGNFIMSKGQDRKITGNPLPAGEESKVHCLPVIRRRQVMEQALVHGFSIKACAYFLQNLSVYGLNHRLHLF